MNEYVKFTEVMPTSNSVKQGESLNVLVGAINKTDKPLEISAAIWGKVENEWKKLLSRSYDLAPNEHRHLYFNIPAECFSSKYWQLDEIDEIELHASENCPSENTEGILVFVKNN